MTTTTSLSALLRDQDGLVTRDQLRRLGWSRSAIGRRVDRGDWARVHPRVYRALDHPWTSRARVRAVGLWLPDDGTLTGRSAAFWWGLTDDAPPTVTAAVPPPGRHPSRPGVTVARRVLAPGDRALVDGVRVTARSLTVLEASIDLGLIDGARLMDRALLRSRVTVEGLEGALFRTAGRHGTRLGRRLLELAAGGARSEAERVATGGLLSAGIGGWVANHRVVFPGWGPAVLDIGFPEVKLAVEIDGWAYHRDVDRFRRDGLRQNAIVMGGWRVLRFTWYELIENLPGVIASIRRAALVTA